MKTRRMARVFPGCRSTQQWASVLSAAYFGGPKFNCAVLGGGVRIVPDFFRRAVTTPRLTKGLKMSRETEFFADMVRASKKAKTGAGSSNKNRKYRLRKFAQWCWDNNYQLEFSRSIGLRHLQLFVAFLLESKKLTIRTVENYTADFRRVLVAVGKGQLARDASNKVLGLGGASRKGKKRAVTQNEYLEILMKAKEHDVGFAACLALMYFLGLRGEEALQAYKSLPTWQFQLQTGKYVTVIYGTKNNRPRDVPPVNKQAALAAIAYARAVAGKRHGKLIGLDLKTALNRYKYLCKKIGLSGDLTGHSMRYAFAQNLKASLLTQGFRESEANSLVSLALGHGDGRGRYVKSVYMNQPKKPGDDQ